MNDINRIVSVYGLSVKEVKTETPYFININDFYTHNAKITRKNVVKIFSFSCIINKSLLHLHCDKKHIAYE